MQNNTTIRSKKTRSPATVAKWFETGICERAQTKTAEETQEERQSPTDGDAQTARG